MYHYAAIGTIHVSLNLMIAGTFFYFQAGLTLTLPFPEGDVLKLLNSLGLLSLSVSTKKARAMI